MHQQPVGRHHHCHPHPLLCWMDSWRNVSYGIFVKYNDPHHLVAHHRARSYIRYSYFSPVHRGTREKQHRTGIIYHRAVNGYLTVWGRCYHHRRFLSADLFSYASAAAIWRNHCADHPFCLYFIGVHPSIIPGSVGPPNPAAFWQ